MRVVGVPSEQRHAAVAPGLQPSGGHGGAASKPPCALQTWFTIAESGQVNGFTSPGLHAEGRGPRSPTSGSTTALQPANATLRVSPDQEQRAAASVRRMAGHAATVAEGRQQACGASREPSKGLGSRSGGSKFALEGSVGIRVDVAALAGLSAAHRSTRVP